jgi:bacillithiol system protein YtxJ
VTVFRPLTTPADLDALIDASHTTPVILFKHSQSCGLSHMARTLLDEGDVPAVVHEVVVQQDRACSTAIAERLGVRHESPQVIVVSAGAATWHGSHAGVTPRRVAEAFQRAVATLTPSPAR